MNIQNSGWFEHVTNHAQFGKKSVDSKFPPVSNSFLNKFYALSTPISILLRTAGGMRENRLTVFV